jgi:UDP-N-acetylmuramate dehydrogenase
MKYELLKEFCISKNINIRFNEPMSIHTSLRIGGPAEVAIFPDGAAIVEIIEMLLHQKIPFIVVGGGTNILVRDEGIKGAVIFTGKMNNIRQNTEHRTQNTDTECISVQSGCSMQRVINLCVDNGLSGIEGLAGIPGSVGGAIAGNAGSFGYEIKDIVESIDVFVDGSVKTLSVKEIGFEYRSSKIPSDAVVLNTVISLKKDDPVVVKKRVNEFINEKKSRQPISFHSAGCVFRNPEGDSAGRIIDEAGCKGIKVGGIEVSSLHANFFINTGSGTASDFLKLMDMVSKKVKDKFGIILEPEIRILGRN